MITINTAISTSAGGIESLIRNLQTISHESTKEYYLTSVPKEIFERNKEVKYISVGEINTGKVKKILTKINLYFMLLFGFSRNEKVIIFHPTDLLYIPLPILLMNEIILVQTNRIDITFTTLGKIAHKLKSRLVDKYTVYTESDKKEYIDTFSYIDKNKIKVIPRGCRIATATNPPMISTKLITIARINEEQKQFSEMIKVVENLPDNYSLSIYGEGTDEEINALQSKISMSSANIEYRGALTDVATALKHHSIFIMTSSFEGFGQTLIEARSQGLPIVVYDTFTAVHWVVKHGTTGFIHTFGDHLAMSRSIEDLLENENLYKDFGNRSLESAKETDSSYVNELWGNI